MCAAHGVALLHCRRQRHAVAPGSLASARRLNSRAAKDAPTAGLQTGVDTGWPKTERCERRLLLRYSTKTGSGQTWGKTPTKRRFVQGCGAKGYNPLTGAHTGPAGAYCCGDTNPPCPTCFYANAALPVVKNGVECFKSLGVPASKLVLAYPWYGYDYTCRAGDSDVCHVTSAKQVRKRISFAPFCTKKDHSTKTGSGQT